jgi:putative FmdB family regulatory protein
MACHPELPAAFGASSPSDDTLVPSVAPVPIYEYVCMNCESHFEELVRGEEQVACPDCAATNVSRQFSTFAVHGATKVATGGGCCGGSCGCGR